MVKYKINVGDEVCSIDPDSHDIGIVTWRNYDDIYIMYSDGSARRTQVKYYYKTGRHFDIDGILKKIGKNDF